MSARTQLRGAVALAGAAVALIVAASPAAAAGPTSLRALAAQDLRLATIGYHIGQANARACSQPGMMTGLVLHSLSQYDRSMRPAVARAFGFNGGFGVLGVVRGSVADQAGLHRDDEIVAIDGTSVEDPLAAGPGRQSYSRVEAFSKLLNQTLARGSTDLTIRHGRQQYQVRLTGQPGCGGQLTLTPSASLNAWADGTTVNLSTAMMNFAHSDDELAFVVAHEMAHNVLGHVALLKNVPSGLFGLFGIGSSRVKRTEVDADAYAVTLMTNAGYRPESAMSFLQRANKRLWWAVSLDHPGWTRRIATVAQAMAKLPHGSASLPNRSTADAELAHRNAAPVVTAAASVVSFPTGSPASRSWN